MDATEAADDRFFLIVAKELAIGRKDEALWTKAFALSDGDANKTKASYIRMRVAKLQIPQAPAIADVSEGAIIPTPNVESTPKEEITPPQAKDPSVVPPELVFSSPEKSDDKDDGVIPDEVLQEFAIGPNARYYTRVFANIDKTKSAASWNWAAFFFTIPWALYRKMWWASALMVVAFIPCAIFDLISQTAEEHGSSAIAFATGLALPAFAIVSGVFGNYWYRQKVRGIVYNARIGYAPKGKDLLAQSLGGTTFVPHGIAIACAVLLILTTIK